MRGLAHGPARMFLNRTPAQTTGVQCGFGLVYEALRR